MNRIKEASETSLQPYTYGETASFGRFDRNKLLGIGACSHVIVGQLALDYAHSCLMILIYNLKNLSTRR
jgi:hypothetical protein